MKLYGSGNHKFSRLGVPTDEDNDDEIVVEVPVNLDGIQCISAGLRHSIIIKENKVWAAGDDTKFHIGSDSRQVYDNFTEVHIVDDKVIWAACGDYFTLYLTVNGEVILCHEKCIDNRIKLDLPAKAVSVFGGSENGGIIDETGAFYFIDNENPQHSLTRFLLGSPAIDLACCDGFLAALCLDGRVFIKKSSSKFSLVPSLKSVKIKKISGYGSACMALAQDGRVFAYGKNDFGQLCDRTHNDCFNKFKEIKSIPDAKFKDIACSYHTLLLTETDDLYGAGSNERTQLFFDTGEKKIFDPTLIAQNENVTMIVVGNTHSFYLVGTSVIENPSVSFFKECKFNEPAPEKPKSKIIFNEQVDENPKSGQVKNLNREKKEKKEKKNKKQEHEEQKIENNIIKPVQANENSLENNINIDDSLEDTVKILVKTVQEQNQKLFKLERTIQEMNEQYQRTNEMNQTTIKYLIDKIDKLSTQIADRNDE